MKLTQDQKEERRFLLEDAQIKIHEAIEAIREAVRDTENERSAEAYIIAHLEGWAEGTNSHEFTAIPRLLEDLEKDEDDEEESE
jgi:Arc/MetJ-type ribon-helix-helix transcriptional regulator